MGGTVRYGFGMGVTGYARVSTDEQDRSAQIAALRRAGADVIYQDRASGRNMDRPEWVACLRSLHRGDVLVVVRLDRLGRSLVDLVGTIEELGHRGVEFRSLNEQIDTTTPSGKLMFQICASFAEYERAMIQARTREGMAAARDRGARIGRPPALSQEQVSTVRRLHSDGESVASIARIFEVSRRTVQRALTS